MPDIYLRTVPSDANPNDVRLYDPTTTGTPAGANFAGNATITFDATGSFRAASSFAGSTSLTFTQSGALRAPATFAGATTVTFTPTGDFVAGAVAGGAVFAGNASITFATTGTFSAGGTAQRDGDGSKKKPIVTIRPKVERDLDDILELVETVSETRRVTENKRTIKEAITAIRAVEAPPNYEKPIAAIQKALVNVSRATAKHEGLETSIIKISLELEALIAEMERKRKHRKTEEEEILYFILHSSHG